MRPDQVRKKLTTNKIDRSKKTPLNKEIRNMMKPTKKPEATVSKASPVSSNPRVYKPDSKATSLSTSQSSVKKENFSSSLLRKKQTASKSLHMSMSLGPSASDPAALTSTRKSLIMERMGDKEIVKRAFKTFQKSYDFTSSVNEQKQIYYCPFMFFVFYRLSTDQLLKHQNPGKATSIPSLATRQKENGRPTKSSSLEKRSCSSAIRSSSYGLKSNNTGENKQKELSKSGATAVEKTRLQKNSKAGVIDAKTRRGFLNPKAKPMQGALPVRTLPKVSSEKRVYKYMRKRQAVDVNSSIEAGDSFRVDTDVGAVLDAMSMAVSHHAAAFADGLQDVKNCCRVTVVGFKTLFPRKEEDHGAGRGTETARRDERSSEVHYRFGGSFGF
ncbi:hypothetical protein Bca52824_076704 [Brassica carinata]|uniref:Uncharacterized protein n=1 Tax=Brassica carinata TaxID=52824 RepID=A0A8X7PUD9_BRACI|nr:hypothetical protein Bca52824_076704 [Brassica carinata]